MESSSLNFNFKFPLLYPRIAESLWFSADKPCDDENELTQMESEYQNWLTGIAQKDSNIIPIGKTESEQYDEAVDDDEEDDDDNDDDDSESNDDDDDDDDLDGDDLNYDQDSLVDPFHWKIY